MATFDISEVAAATATVILPPQVLGPSSIERAVGLNLWTVGRGYSVETLVRMYKMRGEDALTDALYDSWLVEGAPDLDASEYAGALARPLRDVIVTDTWSA